MKKIKTTTIYLSEDDSKAQKIKYYYEERLNSGVAVLEEQYYPDGSIENRVERKYDENGTLVEEKFYSEEGEPDSVHHYQLDNSGKISLIKSVYRDGTVGYKHYEYNEADNSEWVTVKDENGEVEAREYRRYDSEGRALEELTYEGTESLQQKVLTSYDDAGRPVKQEITYEDGYLSTLHYSYEMDDQGRVATAKVTNQKGSEFRYEEFQYDDKNNLVEQYVEDIQNRRTYIRQWEYNGQGQVSVERRLNAQEQPEVEIVYHYNEEGLVVEKETATMEGNTYELYEYEFY